MNDERQRTLLRLIQTHAVRSQEELQSLLERAGFEVTQATVSRDIKKLGLIKMPLTAPDGSTSFKYVQPGDGARYASQLHRLVAEVVESVAGAENLIVLKTPPGSANMVASALDAAGWPEILGTVAGDDTILLICRSKTIVPRLIARFKEMNAAAGSGAHADQAS